MRVGDKLYCKKNYLDMFTVGKTYIILDVMIYLDKIYLSPDNVKGGSYWFLISNTEHEFYYGKYFINLRDDRVKKLNKLGVISNGASSID